MCTSEVLQTTIVGLVVGCIEPSGKGRMELKACICVVYWCVCYLFHDVF